MPGSPASARASTVAGWPQRQLDGAAGLRGITLPLCPSDLVQSSRGDRIQSSRGDRIDAQDGVTAGRAPFREPEADVTPAVERQEEQTVRLASEKAARPEVEAFRVALDCPADRWMDHERDALRLAGLLNLRDPQHA